MLPLRAHKKAYDNDTKRRFGNIKRKGFSRTFKPSGWAELLCRECRRDYDFNTYVFRTHHFNKGIGEWKELRPEVRKKIPFPLVHRPIKDKHGYAVGIGAESRWECRPLHPSDAWMPWKLDLWYRITFLFLLPLSLIIVKRANILTGFGYYRRPFDRYAMPYHYINRLFFWLVLYLL